MKSMASIFLVLKERIQNPKDKRAGYFISSILLLFEIVLCIFIIKFVPYTKIDWDAYMEQVSQFEEGERDYSSIKGDTGPLVYPAGFLYIFSFFKYITRGHIFPSQILFTFIYLFNQFMVFIIYIESETVPPWVLLLLCLSKRLHSIFILRLFNDCVTMAIFYASFLIIQKGAHVFSLILYSISLSVKMNVLLFLPAILIILLKNASFNETLISLTSSLLVQILIGYIFLNHNFFNYLSSAFNFGRVFIHHWSVNFKFVPNFVFISKPFSLSLLFCHLLLLLLLAHFAWTREDGGIFSFLKKNLLEKIIFESKRNSFTKPKPQKRKYNPKDITYILFSCNFIGIIFARSLHYQFYSWYFHSLPFLLWQTKLPLFFKFSLFFLIELCWNIFPSTPVSSLILMTCHLVILLALIMPTKSKQA